MSRSIDEILCLSAARGLPDPCPDGVPCCDGYAYLGADCAFRPGSPERRDSEHAVCDSGDLMRIVHNPAEVFACHDGLRKAIGWRHPNGMFVPHDPTDGVVAYSPPIEGRRAYRLDGTPALHCAGLAAARRAKDWTL